MTTSIEILRREYSKIKAQTVKLISSMTSYDGNDFDRDVARTMADVGFKPTPMGYLAGAYSFHIVAVREVEAYDEYLAQKEAEEVASPSYSYDTREERMMDLLEA